MTAGVLTCINVGCFDASLSDAPREHPWCEIGYTLTNYSLDSNDNKAAAIQLAIWKYIYGQGTVNATNPVAVESRALQIYDDAVGRSVIGCNSTLTLEAVGEKIVAGNLTSQNFTATITNSGCLEGIAVDFSTDNGSFSSTEALGSTTVLTDENGKASVTLYWDSSELSFTATITARTEGKWPVIIDPTGEILRTIISKPCKLEKELTWKIERGSLNVTKSIEWGKVTPFNSTFEICIQGPSYLDGDCQNVTYNGGTISWKNLIPGVYNITETDPGTQWSVVVEPEKVTVVTNQTASANVTNTYKTTADIDVVKTAILRGEGQGCTPDYRKAPQHFANWPAGYNATDNVTGVFLIPDCVEQPANNTLLEALNYGGGSEEWGAAQILLRAAVAAVLNSAHPDVN